MEKKVALSCLFMTEDRWLEMTKCFILNIDAKLEELFRPRISLSTSISSV